MRLVTAEGPQGLFLRLEPEPMPLETCAARGEWTNGRGVEAVETLPGIKSPRFAYARCTESGRMSR